MKISGQLSILVQLYWKSTSCDWWPCHPWNTILKFRNQNCWDGFRIVYCFPPKHFISQLLSCYKIADLDSLGLHIQMRHALFFRLPARDCILLHVNMRYYTGLKRLNFFK